MNTTKKLSDIIAFRLLLFILAASLVVLFTSCKRHHVHTDVTEIVTIVDDGEDDSFYYVPGIDGMTVCGPQLLADASVVLPEEVLADAPEGGSLLLYSGGTYYLAEVEAGTYLDVIVLEEDGYLVVTDLGDLDPLSGVVVEVEGCDELKLRRPFLEVGDVKVRIK